MYKIFCALLIHTCLLVTKSVANNVLQLTKENYNQLTNSHELVFINFYADWCRFSQILAPVFEEAYSNVQKEFPELGRVLFAKVDCEVESELSSRFHISKYPTLKLMMNGKALKREYRGQRSVESITAHVKELLKDPIHQISSYDGYNGIEEKKGAIIGFFSTPPSMTPEYNIFRKVALDLRDDCNFYWVSGEPSAMHLKDGLASQVTFKPTRSKPGEKDLVYPGVLTSYDELSSWSTDKCIPLVREITFENAEELTEEGLPFLILFHNPDDKSSVEAFNQVVHSELYTESSSINFLVADGVKFAHPLHHLGKSQSDLPLIAIDSFRHMYMFPNFKDLWVPGKLKQFILDLSSGKLHREFHFGPDPASNQIETSSPPESTFKKLAPSSNRYTLLRDEL